MPWTTLCCFFKSKIKGWFKSKFILYLTYNLYILIKVLLHPDNRRRLTKNIVDKRILREINQDGLFLYILRFFNVYLDNDNYADSIDDSLNLNESFVVEPDQIQIIADVLSSKFYFILSPILNLDDPMDVDLIDEDGHFQEPEEDHEMDWDDVVEL